MNIEISIIIPAFNESANINHIYQRFNKIFSSKLKVSYEIIFIDNGSKDDSLSKIKKISRVNNSVKYISFTRNFGYQAALKAGLEFSQGNYTMMIDSDCEDPPEFIVDFYKLLLTKKYNLVYGRRIDRFEFFLIKKLRMLFYNFLKYISDHDVYLYMAEFVLIDNKIKTELIKMNKNNRFLFFRTDISFIGGNTLGVNYKRHPRYGGKSKFNFFGMISFAINGILHSSTYFLKYQFLLLIILIFIYIMDSRFVSIILFIQLATISIYLSRIYRTLQNKPSYIVKETNFFL